MKTHGKSKDKLYHVWNGMKQRCYNANDDFYYCYGAKGITVSLNLNLSNLVMVCNGKRKNVKGHTARYLNREAAEARLAELKGEKG